MPEHTAELPGMCCSCNKQCVLLQKADLQQITGNSFVSPATVQAVDMDNSSCSVLWNENDAFKNDRSDSSGGRGADSRAMRQVSSRPVSISDVG